MTKTLYQILGVKKKAKLPDIKKAHRALAQKNHPDKGGDKTRFMQIDMAYKVLRNTKARSRYDQTGEFDSNRVVKEMEEVQNVMVRIYTDLLNSGQAFDERLSIVDGMKGLVNDQISGWQHSLTDFNARLTQLEALKKTITRDDDKQNIFVEVTDDQITKIESTVQNLRSNIALGLKVLEELSLYRSFARAVRTVQVWQVHHVSFFGGVGGGFDTSTTTS